MPVGKVTALMPRLKSQSRTEAVRQSGFTLLAVLVATLLLALASQGVMVWVSQQAQREREEQLIHVGTQYARAIGAYYEATPGSSKKYPTSLDALLEDKRLLTVKRHLRELYPDPVSPQRPWELVMATDGGIQGVHSSSVSVPLRKAAIETDIGTLAAAAQYRDWQFVYQPKPASNPDKPGTSPKSGAIPTRALPIPPSAGRS